jgi:hypothetical protein
LTTGSPDIAELLSCKYTCLNAGCSSWQAESRSDNSTNSPAFAEPEIPLPFSHEFTTGTYAAPDESNPHPQNFFV